MTAPATVERTGRSAVVRLQGDLAVSTAKDVYGQLRALCRRRDVREVKVDFGGAGRIDSAGVAVLAIVEKQMKRAGKTLALEGLQPEHETALALTQKAGEAPDEVVAESPLELLGDAAIKVKDSALQLVDLISETARQGFYVLRRKKKLPKGAFATQVALMGSDGVFIVGLLSFLLGMTMAFQGATVLGQFGADVYVADMIGFSMVRELAPLMTAVIVTGRTGAAIAAELGTMKVRSEVDALSTMGINTARFLVLPRLLAITVIGPALTLMSIGFGIVGGMLVAGLANGMPMRAFWSHLVEVLAFGDFVHGIGKSILFAWIIGLAGCHLGLRAGSDASSVGAATTRTVVSSIFFIIVADALITSIATAMAYS
jgi:phospholipid/cholesterol/gamma-HCH transport system permease protein